MADFLTTSGTSHHIENIIMEAKAKLFLVSPYLKLSKTFYERLKDASGRGVAIKLIYGKDELKPNERNSLAELKNAELFYFQNLHAKCFFNENKMVITSMNMYEFSEKTNREMGILIDRTADRDLFEKAMKETASILKSSEAVPFLKQRRSSFIPNHPFPNNRPKQKTAKGYCIRCEEKINYNPERPLCSSCYAIWAQFENWDFPENVCHSCGENEGTSMAKPECYSCYIKEAAAVR